MDYKKIRTYLISLGYTLVKVRSGGYKYILPNGYYWKYLNDDKELIDLYISIIMK
jgi:hypothetical protein